MGYYDGYNGGHKIPYDDYPVTRNEKSYSGGGSSRGGVRFKAPPLFVAIVLVLNLLFSVTSFILVKTTKYRTINNYVLELGSVSEVNRAVKASAISKTICVTASNTDGTSAGSGVIYKIARNSDDQTSTSYNKGYIYFVTCYHVIEDSKTGKPMSNIYVQLSSSTDKLKVKSVGYSSQYDLAVVKTEFLSNLEYTLAGCSEVSVFDSSYAQQGEQIFAVGNPLGLGITITDGLISQLNSVVVVEGTTHRCLQISAEINPGNSGGGLFNSNGDLVGIVNAKRDEASNGTIVVEGISYAIPSSVVRGIAEQIIAGNSKVRKFDLNVSFSNSAVKSIEPVKYAGETRLIDKYTVSVSAITGTIDYNSSERFIEKDVITKFEYTDIVSGEVVEKIMYNSFSFEDCVFLIKPDSVVKFYIEKSSEPIEIKVNSYDNV